MLICAFTGVGLKTPKQRDAIPQVVAVAQQHSHSAESWGLGEEGWFSGLGVGQELYAAH